MPRLTLAINPHTGFDKGKKLDRAVLPLSKRFAFNCIDDLFGDIISGRPRLGTTFDDKKHGVDQQMTTIGIAHIKLFISVQ